MTYEISMKCNYRASKWLASGNTLVIGYDVCHPEPQSATERRMGLIYTQPSVVGVCVLKLFESSAICQNLLLLIKSICSQFISCFSFVTLVDGSHTFCIFFFVCLQFSYNAAQHPETFIGDYAFHEPRKEQVTDEILEGEVFHILKLFKKSRGKLPSLILITRDGVSEGQYKMVSFICDSFRVCQKSCV